MEALAERMKALLGPFVLRRLKSEVASQLVKKEQRVKLQRFMPSNVQILLLALAQDSRTVRMQAGCFACRHCTVSLVLHLSRHVFAFRRHCVDLSSVHKTEMRLEKVHCRSVSA